MPISFFDTDSSSLPPWIDSAITLLEPVLNVMARPIVVNNLRRVASNPTRPTSAELLRFLDRIEESIATFASRERARAALPPLRRLLQLPGSSR